MDKSILKHKMEFGKNRTLYLILFFGMIVGAVISLLILPNLVIILGACAFLFLILFIVDISNVKRFGSFYAIDVINNQIIEISEKKGERIVKPEDIVEIVQPKDLNLSNPARMNHDEHYFYIKLTDGKTLGVFSMISNYDEFVKKVRSFAEQNNIKQTAKTTDIL
jgi:hypothetical protein